MQSSSEPSLATLSVSAALPVSAAISSTAQMTDWSEEALQASLQDHPWRLRSQVWVALFGGIVASTAIAWVNAERLGLSPERRKTILLVGGGFFFAALGFTLLRIQQAPLETWQEQLRASRGIELALALLFWGVAAVLQRKPHVEGTTSPRPTAPVGSLWAPGLSAVALLGLPGRLIFSLLVLLLA